LTFSKQQAAYQVQSLSLNNVEDHPRKGRTRWPLDISGWRARVAFEVVDFLRPAGWSHSGISKRGAPWCVDTVVLRYRDVLCWANL
jgi:hypothetical protein